MTILSLVGTIALVACAGARLEHAASRCLRQRVAASAGMVRFKTTMNLTLPIISKCATLYHWWNAIDVFLSSLAPGQTPLM